MKSQEIIIEAPMSFAGSAKRIWRMSEEDWVKWLVLIPIISFVWCVILTWYFCFGLLVVPYRLIRRSQRKQKQERLRHDEIVEALKP